MRTLGWLLLLVGLACAQSSTTTVPVPFHPPTTLGLQRKWAALLYQWRVTHPGQPDPPFEELMHSAQQLSPGETRAIEQAPKANPREYSPTTMP